VLCLWLGRVVVEEQMLFMRLWVRIYKTCNICHCQCKWFYVVIFAIFCTAICKTL